MPSPDPAECTRIVSPTRRFARHRDRVPPRHRHALGVAAVAVDAEDPDLAAQVLAPLGTVPARAARQDGVDDDPLAGPLHDARDIRARHERQREVRELAPPHPEVQVVQGASLHVDRNFALGGTGVRPVRERQRVRVPEARERDGPHGGIMRAAKTAVAGNPPRRTAHRRPGARLSYW
jgi:hypothetical protein